MTLSSHTWNYPGNDDFVDPVFVHSWIWQLQSKPNSTVHLMSDLSKKWTALPRNSHQGYETLTFSWFSSVLRGSKGINQSIEGGGRIIASLSLCLVRFLFILHIRLLFRRGWRYLLYCIITNELLEINLQKQFITQPEFPPIHETHNA